MRVMRNISREPNANVPYSERDTGSIVRTVEMVRSTVYAAKMNRRRNSGTLKRESDANSRSGISAYNTRKYRVCPNVVNRVSA